MVYRSELDTYINGNFSQLDKDALIRLCRYFEDKSEGREPEVEEDVEE